MLIYHVVHVENQRGGAGKEKNLETSRVASEAHELVGEKEVRGEDSAEEEDDGNIILSDSDVSDDPYIYNMAPNARKARNIVK